jgi:hypothetical protein
MVNRFHPWQSRVKHLILKTCDSILMDLITDWGYQIWEENYLSLWNYQPSKSASVTIINEMMLKLKYTLYHLQPFTWIFSHWHTYKQEMDSIICWYSFSQSNKKSPSSFRTTQASTTPVDKDVDYDHESTNPLLWQVSTTIQLYHHLLRNLFTTCYPVNSGVNTKYEDYPSLTEVSDYHQIHLLTQ